MPLITAKRRGPCAACSMPIEPGERISYERAVGPRHLACTDREAEARRNLYPMPCGLCGYRLLRGQGELHYTESQGEGGAFRRSWLARCVDVAACGERLAHVR